MVQERGLKLIITFAELVRLLERNSWSEQVGFVACGTLFCELSSSCFGESEGAVLSLLNKLSEMTSTHSQ